MDWTSADTTRMKQEVNSRFYRVLVDLCQFYVTEIVCVNFGTHHDRDENASVKCDSFSRNREIGG